jgi:hypothetical protein
MCNYSHDWDSKPIPKRGIGWKHLKSTMGSSGLYSMGKGNIRKAKMGGQSGLDILVMRKVMVFASSLLVNWQEIAKRN